MLFIWFDSTYIAISKEMTVLVFAAVTTEKMASP